MVEWGIIPIVEQGVIRIVEWGVIPIVEQGVISIVEQGIIHIVEWGVIVTCHAGVAQAWGSGWVRLRVRADVASASRSLCRLIFHVRVFSRSGGLVAGSNERGAEGQEGYECRVDNISLQCYSITKLILLLGSKGLFIQYGSL